MPDVRWNDVREAGMRKARIHQINLDHDMVFKNSMSGCGNEINFFVDEFLPVSEAEETKHAKEVRMCMMICNYWNRM
jgi:hypothetical protein